MLEEKQKPPIFVRIQRRENVAMLMTFINGTIIIFSIGLYRFLYKFFEAHPIVWVFTFIMVAVLFVIQFVATASMFGLYKEFIREFPHLLAFYDAKKNIDNVIGIIEPSTKRIYFITQEEYRKNFPDTLPLATYYIDGVPVRFKFGNLLYDIDFEAIGWIRAKHKVIDKVLQEAREKLYRKHTKKEGGDENE